MNNKLHRLKTLCFLVFITIIINLIGTITVLGATNVDINRIFTKVKNESNFMTELYKAGVNYKDQGVDNTYIDREIKTFIGNVLDDVKSSYKSGNLNDSNFMTKLKEIVIARASSLDVFILSIISDAFPNDVPYVIRGEIPPSFNSLFTALEYETKVIIGLIIVPTPTPTPSGGNGGGGGGGGGVVVVPVTPIPTKTPEVMIPTLPNLPEIEEGAKTTFSDMSEYSWADKAVLSLSKLGILNGMSENEFAPSQNVKREQFAKMLATAIKIDVSNTKSNFADVPKDSWFYPYVGALADLGFLNGVDKVSFGTGYDISRQDMAVLMFRIGQKTGKFSEIEADQVFFDINTISDYAKPAVNTLRALGILNGTPENYFKPTKPATRAESAQMLYNFYQYITK